MWDLIYKCLNTIMCIMYVYIYVQTFVYIIYKCGYICIHVYVCVYTFVHTIYMCGIQYMYICIFICMYMCIYIVYTFVYIIYMHMCV